MSNRKGLYPGPTGRAPFIIFARDRFQYSLFGLNMIPVPFPVIQRRQPFSCAQLRIRISQPSRECSFYNFRVQLLPIFVIWPKYAPHAISHDSETAIFSSSLLRTLISWPSRQRSYYKFRAQLLPIFVIWPKYATRATSCDFERATFFAHANVPALPGALVL